MSVSEPTLIATFLFQSLLLLPHFCFRAYSYCHISVSEPTLIAKSNIILDVKPWDDETDMAELEAQVRKITMDGLLWGACTYSFKIPFICSYNLTTEYDGFHLPAMCVKHVKHHTRKKPFCN